jgi:hypothetical protein
MSIFFKVLLSGLPFHDLTGVYSGVWVMDRDHDTKEYIGAKPGHIFIAFYCIYCNLQVDPREPFEDKA